MALILHHSLDEGVVITGQGRKLEVIVRVISPSRVALEVRENDSLRPFFLYEHKKEELASELSICRSIHRVSGERVKLVYFASREKYHILRRELAEKEKNEKSFFD